MEALLTAANWMGSALCHQWDSHSYIINGLPLPLCARCTGTYLGALLTLVYLALKTRGAVGMPRPAYLFAFLMFFVIWAGDGVNSLATTLKGAPFLYTPQNGIRLTTGMFMGIALGSLVYVVLNSLLKPVRAGSPPPPLYERAHEFLILVALTAILVLTITSGWNWLFYPLTAFLLVAMLVVNTAFWLGIFSSFSSQPSRRAVLQGNVVMALGATILVLNGLAYARTLLTLLPEPPL